MRRWLKPIRLKRWWKWLVSAAWIGRRYFIRLRTTNVVSRNGTARITSGAIRPTRAEVLTEPMIATLPSSRPSRLDPLSPMKTRAG